MQGDHEVNAKYNRIRAEASSKSINIITNRIEDDFGIKAEGSKPRQRFESAYSQMKENIQIKNLSKNLINWWGWLSKLG